MMNTNIVIRCIRSYSQKDEIIRFIESAFELSPEINAIFSQRDANLLVVIKPNWVQETHEYRPDVWEPVITNPQLLLIILYCLAERIRGKATICVCDAPHTYADFTAIIDHGEFAQQFRSLSDKYPSITFELLDLRREIWTRKEEVIVERRKNSDDPRGYVHVNLGESSLFYGHSGEGRYYGADYDSKIVNSHHQDKIHEYMIAGTPIACDLFINVPKMKTHKKTGITCCLKNLVGINGDKNFLPHHTEGNPLNGGDEFPEHKLSNQLEFYTKSIGKKVALKLPGIGNWLYRKMRNTGKRVLGDSETVIRNGNWSGNNTCWRMALDLNRALLYANSNGSFRDRLQPKAYLAIVDGIIGGQGNGPLCPDPIKSNVLISGTNPAEVDAVAAKLMGFNPYKLPIIVHSFDTHRWPIAENKDLNDIAVFDDRVGKIISLNNLKPAIEGGFTPHFGWNDIRDI